MTPLVMDFGPARFVGLCGLALVLGLGFAGAAWGAPANDNFADRIVLAGTTVTSQASIAGATREPGEPNPNGISPGASLWWEWTAPSSGGVAVEGAGDALVPAVAVFTGDSLAGLALLSRGYGGVSSTKIGFRAEAGQRYVIALDVSGFATGRVTLRLKPGPPNDDFANRTQISGAALVASGTLDGATREVGEPVHAPNETGMSVWWEWIAPFTGGAWFSATAPDTLLALAVYAGDVLTNLTLLAADSAGDGTETQVSVSVVAGTAYAIALANLSSYPSAVSLSGRPGPQNDNFAQRAVLGAAPLTVSGTTQGATREPAEPDLGLGAGHGSVWYEWTAPQPGGWTLRLSVPSGGATAVLTAGTTLADLAPRATVSALPTSSREVVFRTAAEERLFIGVSGLEAGGNRFTLSLLPGPPNDDFANRLAVTVLGVPYSASNTGATREPGEPAHQGRTSGRSVWWEWIAPATGGYWLETPLPVTPPFLGVYQGDALTELAAVPLTRVSDATTAQAAFYALMGQRYFIVLDDQYPFGRNVSCTLRAGPANDIFGAALRLVGLDEPVAGTTVGATLEPGEAWLWPGEGATVWHVWTAPATGGYAARLSPQSVPMWMAVFTGRTVNNLVEVGRGPPAIGPGESVAGFHGVAGQDYYLMADSTGLNRGPFTLAVSAAAANDDFANRADLGGLNLTNTVPAFLGTLEQDEPLPGGRTNAPSLWWTWTAPATGGYVARASHEYAITVLAVFAGRDLANLTPAASATIVSSDHSAVFFHADAGVAYAIRLAQEPQRLAPVTLVIQSTPANDDFARALPLEGGSPTNTLIFQGATREPGEPLLAGLGEAGTVWYRWTAPASGGYLARAQLASAPSLAVAVCAEASLTDLVPLTVGVAPGPSQPAQTAWRALAGVTYDVVVAAAPLAAEAPLTLTLAPGPANDDFIQRAALEGVYVAVAGTTLGATREPDEPIHAGRTNAASVWFTWTAPESGPYVASVVAGSAPSAGLALRVFTGDTLGSLTALGTDLDSGRLGARPRRAFAAVAGTVYQLAVESAVEGMGSFTLRLGPAPPNDDFAQRMLLAGTNVTVFGANWNATTELLVEGSAHGALNSVWWSWTAPADGLLEVRLSAAEPQVWPILEAYTGPATSQYSGAFQGAPLRRSNVLARAFAVTSGLTYDLRVGSLGGDSTNLTLALALDAQPALGGEWARGPFPWVRGGDALWFSQTNQVHDPPDALQSGHLVPRTDWPDPPWDMFTVGPSAWIQTTFLGPGTLEFWWKLAAIGQDQLRCELFRASRKEFPPPGLVLAGQHDWARQTLTLPDRTNVVRWTYLKPYQRTGDGGAGWLDTVSFTPRPPKAVSLGPPRRDPGGVWRLGLAAEAQRYYHLLSSTNLSTWTELTNVFVPANSVLRFRWPVDTNLPALFLRVLAE